MEKELRFIINGKELYLECVLLEKENVPTAFICSDADEHYYLAVFIEREENTYIVTPVPTITVIKLVMRMTSLTETFKNNISYKVIVNKEDINKSIVTEIDPRGYEWDK